MAKVATHALLPGHTLSLPAIPSWPSWFTLRWLREDLNSGPDHKNCSHVAGGDRPKNAEEEFPGVCSLPRGAYEPWGVFRNPLPSGMTVGECLRRYGTGGLRRLPEDLPFSDILDIGGRRKPSEKLRLIQA